MEVQWKSTTSYTLFRRQDEIAPYEGLQWVNMGASVVIWRGLHQDHLEGTGLSPDLHVYLVAIRAEHRPMRHATHAEL